VSQVILRRFCDRGGELTAYLVDSRRTKPLGPAGLAYVQDLNPVDPIGFEQQWKAVEDRLPEALVAVDDGSIFASRRLVDLLRDCLAMHWARSYNLVLMYASMLPRILDHREREMLSDPMIEHVFRSQHRGLWPAGGESRALAAQYVRDRVANVFDASGFLSKRMLANFDEARARVAGVPLQIVVAGASEFLIGDSPAQSLNKDRAGIGPLGGIPWGEATTVTMPLGRRHAVALGPRNEYIELDQREVGIVNRFQLSVARRHVAWHPDADIERFVDAYFAAQDE
jgi:hypothetical protein